jgi:hypothetical protein
MERSRTRDPGCKKVGSGIRDKHPGSAALVEDPGSDAVLAPGSEIRDLENKIFPDPCRLTKIFFVRYGICSKNLINNFKFVLIYGHLLLGLLCYRYRYPYRGFIELYKTDVQKLKYQNER